MLSSAPDPPIAMEILAPTAVASLTLRVENGVDAIQKWVPFTPKCPQTRWQLGLRPRPLNVRESSFGACYFKMGSNNTQMLLNALAAGAPPEPH